MSEFIQTEALIQHLEELRKLNEFERTRQYLKPLLIGFFIGRKNKKKIKELGEEINDILQQKSFEIETKVSESLDNNTFLITAKKKDILKSIDALKKGLENFSESELPYVNSVEETLSKLSSLRDSVINYNSDFIKQRKQEYSNLWNNRGYILDSEQQTAIITDDKHNLVVAAAGSGKTEVLITRIAYLIKRKPDSVCPERILAIAYQRKAKEEIEKRLEKRYGIRSTNTSTFHKLGKSILEEANKSKYHHADIVDENKKHDIIEKIFFNKFQTDHDFYSKFLRYVKTLYSGQQEQDDSCKEVLEYSKKMCYRSINNVRVKSRAEEEIMDFFVTQKLNEKSIRVKYEPDVSGFKPDFYLPDYEIYLEHWALNKKGEVPEWFSQTSKDYKKAMEMKKKWFTENNKILIETFAYEYDENYPQEFTELLKKKLSKAIKNRVKVDCTFSRKSYYEIVNIAWKSQQTPIEDCLSFITTAKTFGLSPNRIKERLKQNMWNKSQRAFGEFVLPIFYDYEKILKEYDEIDFEDMINSALIELDNNPNLRNNVYDHILIDEYQDISDQRFKLIKKLMDRNPNCKLFCVGDDWQSIMAFSGSKINLFVKFGEYFNDPAITIISTNYRSNKTIVHAGAKLIKHNITCQIQKPTRANNSNEKPIKVISAQAGNEFTYQVQSTSDCIDRIKDYLESGHSPEDILVLTRFMRTRIKSRYRFLENIKQFLDTANQRGLEIVCGNAYSKSKVRLLTVHKSKGIEAKVVFLLNVTRGVYGFPSEIQNSEVLELARIDYPEQDRLEEERRLFYVALTRAKEDLYVYTWEAENSTFLDEVADYTTSIKLGNITEPENEAHNQIEQNQQNSEKVNEQQRA